MIQNFFTFQKPITKTELEQEKRIQKLGGKQPMQGITRQPSDTTPESPILLLIMAKSGLPLYTKIFSKEWKFREGLFSSFLSAFNSFSTEIFSEGLDRANFGKFTILMKGKPPFRSCYVFKGRSFLAQQKFTQFNESLHASEPIRQRLTSADHSGRVIRDDLSEGLAQLVQTIF
jgi:hypothetical protein